MTQLPPTETGDATSGRLSRAVIHSGLLRLSVARFLGALVLLFVAAPLMEDLKDARLIETVLFTVVLGMGVLAVGARRRILVWAIVLVLPAVLGNWIHHFWPELWPAEAVFGARILFVGFVAARLLVFILRAPQVNSEVLCAGISIYLLLGLLWGMAYMLVGSLAPDAFAFSVPATASHSMTRFNAFYFSYITLTTVGYGDITPVSNLARVLAMLEAMTGTLFVGILIARLVSLYSSAAAPAGPSSTPADDPLRKTQNP